MTSDQNFFLLFLQTSSGLLSPLYFPGSHETEIQGQGLLLDVQPSHMSKPFCPGWAGKQKFASKLGYLGLKTNSKQN